MTYEPSDRVFLDLMDTVDGNYLKRSLRVIFTDIKRTIRILATRPSLFIAGSRILLHRKKAAKLRRKAKADGLDIPTIMLVSITSQCNLSCPSCYMQQREIRAEPEMNLHELRSLVSQAEDLGTTVISLVGGEPLLRKSEVTDLARTFPKILFTLSTNGLLIDTKVAEDIAGCANIIPFISFEGFQKETDNCRGQGVYDRLLNACSLLDERVLFFGCAITVSRSNIREVLDEPFIRTMLHAGARAFIFIQYVPVKPGTEDLVPTAEQRELLKRSMYEFNRKYPAFFIGIPGDMELFGGCLAAGRGFIHVSPYGDLEPCPIVPLSDANLREMPLKDALQSRILETIRRNHRSLHANGRCALRTHPRWLEELLSME